MPGMRYSVWTRRERMVAFIASLGLHTLLLVLALAYHLDQLQVPSRSVAVILTDQTSERETSVQERAPAQRLSRTPSSSGIIRAVRAQPAPPTATQEASRPDEQEQPVVVMPADTVCTDVIPTTIPTTSVLAGMSQEEALGELLHLLGKHPEFKETILRELLAGDGAVDPVPPLEIFGLEQLLKLHAGKLALPGALARGLGGVNPNPVYHPVHGLNGNPVGMSINYLGILLKLIELIKGE